MDYRKQDAARVSIVLGCASLLAMALWWGLSLAAEANPALRAEGLLVFRTLLLAVFCLPAIWGVWKLRRLTVHFPAPQQRASLNKRLAVMLSTFGMIVIIRILYASVFPSAVESAGVNAEMTATELFLLFALSTVASAVAEEIFFRGFFLRSMRIQVQKKKEL